MLNRLDEDDVSQSTNKRSIIDLAVTAYEKEIAPETTQGPIEPIKSIESMPKSLRCDLIDSVKTFIFAGHDTTVSLRMKRVGFGSNILFAE